MEEKLTPLDRSFRPLLNRPCWQVTPDWGSFLTMEFGEPSLKIRNPIPLSKFKSLQRPSVRLRGQWHFWLQECQWFLFEGANLVGSWIDEDTRASAATILDGQKLMHAAFDPETASSQFEFDLGAKLETLPYDDQGIQWSLYEPDGRVLSYRADGKIQHIPVDAPDDDVDWCEPS